MTEYINLFDLKITHISSGKINKFHETKCDKRFQHVSVSGFSKFNLCVHCLKVVNERLEFAKKAIIHLLVNAKSGLCYDEPVIRLLKDALRVDSLSEAELAELAELAIAVFEAGRDHEKTLLQGWINEMWNVREMDE